MKARTAMLISVLLVSPALSQTITIPGREPAPAAAPGDTDLTDRLRRMLIGDWVWIAGDENAGYRRTTTVSFSADGRTSYSYVEELTKEGKSYKSDPSYGYYRVEGIDEQTFNFTFWADNTAPTTGIRRFPDPDTLAIDGADFVYKRVK